MTSTNRAKKILIVEDDPGIAELLKTVLENEQYRVRICSDGGEAVETIKKERPNLVLLDLWIPKISGEKIVINLKKNPETSEIPVIIVSAQNNLEGVVRKIGADGFLEKPFDIDKLLAVVKQNTEI